MKKRILYIIYCLSKKQGNIILLFLALPLFSLESLSQEVQVNGYNKFLYPNGQISSEGYMKNGKPDGYWKTYYVTGILKSEGKRENFKLDSLWIFYNQLGDTIEKINYKYGKKNGYDIIYHYDQKKNTNYKGYIFSKELYLNGKKEGLTYQFYSEGNIRRKENYLNGKLQGIAYEYTKKGEIISLFEYNNGYLINREKINRKDIYTLSQGRWKDFYPNGKVHIERNYLDGKLNDYFKEYDETGNLKLTLRYKQDILINDTSIAAEIIDIRNKFDTNGILIESGAYLKNIPVGIHRKYSKDGTVINAFVYSNSGNVVSEGIIDEKGTKKGSWKDFYENGKLKDEGKYLNSKRTGNWTFYNKNGKIEQDGNYRNGKINGPWKWYFDSGKLRREENYFNGNEDGQSVEYSDSGKVIVQGEYINGEKENEWIHKIGDIKEVGSYITGLKEGLWRNYYRNESLQYEGSYVKGLANGKHKYYYSDGSIKEEQYYEMGSREKVWKKYDEEGIIILTINYKNDLEKRINGVKVNLESEVKRIK